MIQIYGEYRGDDVGKGIDQDRSAYISTKYDSRMFLKKIKSKESRINGRVRKKTMRVKDTKGVY